MAPKQQKQKQKQKTVKLQLTLTLNIDEYELLAELLPQTMHRSNAAFIRQLIVERMTQIRQQNEALAKTA